MLRAAQTMTAGHPMNHTADCDCDECAFPKARKPPASLGRLTLRLAMIWTGFRIIADLASRAASALATPAALALLAWILWNKR